MALEDIDYADNKTDAQIQNNFTYHAPTGDQPAQYEALRDEFRRVATMVNILVPGSREKSVALTKLEEAMMWANAGIARN